MERRHVRGAARRRHAADGLHRAVHRRADARREPSGGRPHRRHQEICILHEIQATIIAEATTYKGRIIGVPYAAYAQALHYNRQLFKQAGLDPNKPPTTWAQVRQYAKQIADKTGQAGYAQMGLNDNTAGWILTTVTYTLGGRIETGRGTSAVATVNNGYTVSALSVLRNMRWVDNSMGSTFDYTWPTINQAFAAGRSASHQRLGHLHVPGPVREPQPEHLRHRAASAREEQERRSHGRRVDRRRSSGYEGREAGRGAQWIDFFYMEKLVKKSAALRDARILVANKQPVGIPSFPIFNKKLFDQANTWIKPYVNVPLKQMSPFLTGIFKQNLYPEPAAATQSVYHSLDPVVQSVFTDKNANIRNLLDQANSVAQNAIKAGKPASRPDRAGGETTRLPAGSGPARTVPPAVVRWCCEGDEWTRST